MQNYDAHNYQVNLAFPQIKKTEFCDLYIIFEATKNLAQLYCGKKLVIYLKIIDVLFHELPSCDHAPRWSYEITFSFLIPTASRYMCIAADTQRLFKGDMGLSCK